MKQEDAFTSCKVVDGTRSLPHAIKKDVKQYLLKLNNVQIGSLDNTYPWVLKGHAEELPWIANTIFKQTFEKWGNSKEKELPKEI